MPWKPQAEPAAALKARSLSPLLGYVAARLDGATDLATLTAKLGLPRERLEALVHELIVLGAVAPEVPPPPGSPAAGGGEVGGAPNGARAPRTSAQSAGPEVRVLPIGDPAPLASAKTVVPEASVAHSDPTSPASPADSTPNQLDVPEPPAPGGPPSATEPNDAAPAEEPEAQADDEATAATGKLHRALYEHALRQGTSDERVAAAALAVEPELSAWCFDPLPAVIGALLENPRAGLTHARLIARHHHNAVGLELLLRRAAFGADQGVRRALLQNPQLSVAAFRRLWQGRRPLELYSIAISREVLEQSKRGAREVLRARFSTGPAEDRVEVIVKTEGRCLNLLLGLPLDAKATALLCARTFGSTTLVQNLARWSAAPPALIAHLLRQELVKRSPMLRTLLERHPNAPHRA
jgi:hypothetical protein